jgi:hypothetical protein
MKERHLQTYWPESNVLITRRFDPVSGEPDYNALVTVEPVGPLAGTTPARIVESPPVPASTPEPQPAVVRSRPVAP